MNNQEAFDKVYAHLMAQKKQSAIKTEKGQIFCKYRSPDGLKCAIGCLISDHDYDKEMESIPVRSLIDDVRFINKPSIKSLKEADRDLLYRLQAVHDLHDPDKWEAELRNIAYFWRLKIPAPSS